jgi:outer membrane immunogenic protein
MRNLKLIAAATAVGAMLGMGVASAADLPIKAAPLPVAPPFSWTGFYIGGNAGAGILHDQGFEFQPVGIPLAVRAAAADRDGFGGLAGGQIGYNYQIGMLVLGIEGEGFWSGMKVNQDQFDGTTLISTASIRNKWDFDVAGRFGVAFDRALVYGKAGWVAGGFDWFGADPFNRFNNQGSATLNGLLIGIGLEYAFTNNWTAKFEYNYLGYPSQDVNFSSIHVATGATVPFIQNVSTNKNIFKVGFNYLFNAAPVARY